MAIEELLKERRNEKKPLLQLTELTGVNLCDLWLTVNRYELVVQKDAKTFFEITAPTIISAQFTLAQLQELERLLREKQVRYGVFYLPPYYLKGQGNTWLADLELDCGHGKPQTTTLVDFGYTYGEITVNGIPTSISHSGGTRNGTWVDFTSGFKLVGKNKTSAIRSLIPA